MKYCQSSLFFSCYSALCLTFYHHLRVLGPFFFELGIPFAIFLTTVLFDHSGINQFFMDKHPKIHDATTVIWHLMVQFYVKAKEFIYYMWNFIEEIFLHLFRSNQIHPYHVNQ